MKGMLSQRTRTCIRPVMDLEAVRFRADMNSESSSTWWPENEVSHDSLGSGALFHERRAVKSYLQVPPVKGEA